MLPSLQLFGPGTSGHTESKAWAGEEAQDDSLLLRGVVWQLEPVTKAH